MEWLKNLELGILQKNENGSTSIEEATKNIEENSSNALQSAVKSTPSTKTTENNYSLNLVLPDKSDPNNNDALTDEEKRKRMFYLMGGILAAIIILIIALKMRSKK